MEKRAVLFVDDDEIVLKSIEKSLTDESYIKYFAKSGEDAIEILQREEVHVIVVDIVMPGMGGLELLKIVRKEYPNIVSMVLSGYAQSADVRMVMPEAGVYRFIPKSWTFDEDLRTVIQQAIDNYNLQREHQDMVAELEGRSDQHRMTACPTNAE
jgi:two-component system response regulator HupR/HoxA